MKIDKYGSVVMEHSSPEGNIGDAMADTSRVAIWARETRNYDILNRINLLTFRTDYGYLRHKDAPFKGQMGSDGQIITESWREDDTSGDQYTPWWEAMTETLYANANAYRKEMKARVVKNFGRYGNGNFIHLDFATRLAGWNWGTTQAMNAQVDLFDYKWRWSDEHNSFEPNENSSADYMNWFSLAYREPSWLIQRVPKFLIKEKISHYYFTKEKENANWVIQLAFAYVDTVWGKK